MALDSFRQDRTYMLRALRRAPGFFTVVPMAPLILATLLASAYTFAQPPSSNWPQFRGYQAQGIAEGHSLPTTWDAPSNQGIEWRTSTPGLGLSSPVVWGNKLFITTAVSQADDGKLRLGLYGDIASVDDQSEHIWKVLCYDKRNGDLLWERGVHRGIPKVKRHTKSSHANATLATDGEHLIACFGSEGLFCLNLDGTILWKKDLGTLDAGYFKVPEAQWGFGSSPVIHDGRAVVLADVQQKGFLASYRLTDGRRVWRVNRSDVPTWGTPLVVTAGGRTQVVVNGYKHAGGYDLETGEQLWRVEGGGDIPVPTPIHGEGLFYLTNSHGDLAPVYAVDPTHRGAAKLTREASEGLAWVAHRQGSYMQTPLLLRGLLYTSRWNGVLVCLRAKTGELVYRERAGRGAFTSSPVGGDGKIYIGSEEGDVHVIAAGETYKLLATNKLGEALLATPAISEGVIYFRTAQSLIAVGQ